MNPLFDQAWVLLYLKEKDTPPTTIAFYEEYLGLNLSFPEPTLWWEETLTLCWEDEGLIFDCNRLMLSFFIIFM